MDRGEVEGLDRGEVLPRGHNVFELFKARTPRSIDKFCPLSHQNNSYSIGDVPNALVSGIVQIPFLWLVVFDVVLLRFSFPCLVP